METALMPSDPWVPLTGFLCGLCSSLLEFHVMCHFVWLLLLIFFFWDLSHVINMCTSTSTLLVVEWNFIVWLYHSLLMGFSSVQSLSSVQLFVTHGDCSTPGFSVHPQPPELAQIYPLSRWCHQTILSSVVPFSSCLQSFPVSQFFTSSGQSIGALASASVLPMNIQDWFPLGWTG